MDIPSVRLEGGGGKPRKKKEEKQRQSTLKLAIRLTEGVNDALRTLIRYRGDLSAMAIEALTAVNLESVGLVSVEEEMVRDTTITLTRAMHKKLKRISDDRDTSMNILVNTGLAHWLAAKGALKLR